MCTNQWHGCVFCPVTQVDGCGKDLSTEKSYLQRYSVCEMHFKADVAVLHGCEVSWHCSLARASAQLVRHDGNASSTSADTCRYMLLFRSASANSATSSRTFGNSKASEGVAGQVTHRTPACNACSTSYRPRPRPTLGSVVQCAFVHGSCSWPQRFWKHSMRLLAPAFLETLYAVCSDKLAAAPATGVALPGPRTATCGGGFRAHRRCTKPPAPRGRSCLATEPPGRNDSRG